MNDLNLPNITIEKIKQNEEKWEHLFRYIKHDLNFSEKIILYEYCNMLHVENWRVKKREEIILECVFKLEKKLQTLRK